MVAAPVFSPKVIPFPSKLAGSPRTPIRPGQVVPFRPPTGGAKPGLSLIQPRSLPRVNVPPVKPHLPAPASVGLGAGIAAGLDLGINALDGEISGGDIASAAGTGIGAAVGTYGGAALGALVAGPVGAAVGAQLGGAIGGLAGGFAARSLFPNTPGSPDPYDTLGDAPFTGGQSPGVSYRFDYFYSGWQTVRRDKSGTYTSTGPIRFRTDFYEASSTYNMEEIWLLPGSGGEVLFANSLVPKDEPQWLIPSFSVTNIRRVDGQPDTGGDPEGLPEPVTPSEPNPIINPSVEPQPQPLPWLPGIPFLPMLPPATNPPTKVPPTSPNGPGPLTPTTPARPPNTAPKPAKPPQTVPSANPIGDPNSKPNGNPAQQPLGNPDRTKKDSKCGCNKGLLSGVGSLFEKYGLDSAQLGLLTKINATTIATNGAVGTVLAVATATKAFVETAWKATHADKIINALTLMTTLHNAAMISRDVGETMGYVVSNALAVVGIKDEHDNPLNISEMVGDSVENFIKSVVGEDVYNDTRTLWHKSNRVLQSASNIVWTIRSIQDTTQDVVEWTAENTGKIGNALKKFGVVGDRAYPWMSERVRAQDAYRNKLSRLFEGLESAENLASSLAQVTGDVREIQDEVSELGEARQRFSDAVTDLGPDDLPTVSPENTPIASADVAEVAASASPDVNIGTDGQRGSDPNDTP